MKIYERLLCNEDYLNIVKKIENIRFITDGKWDWEHGLGHYKRVANYVKSILSQLGSDKRTIELGMTAAFLHDMGLYKGNKVDHALESSRIFKRYLNPADFKKDELMILEQAIKDHSNGYNIQTLIGLSLVLADKLDITFHRTKDSSIQDKMNKEVQKIKRVDVKINNNYLIVNYLTDEDFDRRILKDWNKSVLIPEKVAQYLNREYMFMINGKVTNYKEFIF